MITVCVPSPISTIRFYGALTSRGTASAPCSSAVRIPLRVRDEHRHCDLRGIVVRFTRRPVLAHVLQHAVRRAQQRRLRAGRVGGPGGVRPGIEPARRNQIFCFASGTPVYQRLRALSFVTVR